ncbi:MAG: hypothetical protein RPS47_09280 [Colwellia sp.]
MANYGEVSWELMIFKYLIENKERFLYLPVIIKLEKGELLLKFDGLNSDIQFHLTANGTYGQFEFILDDIIFDIQFGDYDVQEINIGNSWSCKNCECSTLYPNRYNLWESHLNNMKYRINYFKDHDNIIYCTVSSGIRWCEICSKHDLKSFADTLIPHSETTIIKPVAKK